MKCVLIFCVLFSVTWCELSKEDILTVFYSKCDNTVNTINKKIAALISIPAKKGQGGVILKPLEEKQQKDQEEEIDEEEEDENGGVEKKEGEPEPGKEAEGGAPGAEGGPGEPGAGAEEPENPQEPEQYNATYYCALTKLVRLAPEFKLTGLVYYQHPPNSWYPPITEVANKLNGTLSKYIPVGVGPRAHYPIGCEVQISNIRRKKFFKKKKKKKGKKFKWEIIPQYRLNCLALTGDFVLKFFTEFALALTGDLEPLSVLIKRYQPE